MSTGIRKTIHYLLTIMLAVLPFTTVYSDSCHPGVGADMEMQGQILMMDCPHPEHSGDMVHTEQTSDDNCCSDHCDASFGVQLYLGGEWVYTFPSASVFATYTPSVMPNPLISSFLRPPLTIS
ncbi:MAG: hypothetical protein RPU52_03735 [Candidatus Sedimenticola sp. (ex Thyasira tokunagai)]